VYLFTNELLGLCCDRGFALFGGIELLQKVARIAFAGRLLQQARQLLAFGALALFR
jgi:hypothetical protein